MALNPPVLPGGMPMGMNGEFYCLQRAGIVFKLDSHDAGVGKLEAKGILFVTTFRLCFIPSNPSSAHFTAFDIPLDRLEKEEFKQPIFGANYLAGTVVPVPGRGLLNPTPFRLIFNEGGAGTFLHVFFGLMEKYRTTRPNTQVREQQFAPPAMAAFIQEQQAYVDASDPSVLFIVQPVQTQAAAPPGGWGGGYATATATAPAPSSATTTTGATTTIITSGIAPPQQQQAAGSAYPSASAGYYSAQEPVSYPPTAAGGGRGGGGGGGYYSGAPAAAAGGSPAYPYPYPPQGQQQQQQPQGYYPGPAANQPQGQGGMQVPGYGSQSTYGTVSVVRGFM